MEQLRVSKEMLPCLKNRYLKINYLIAIVVINSIVACKSIKVAEKDRAIAIAYNVAVKDSLGNSNYEIFTMNMDGSNSKNITNNKDVAWTYRAYNDVLYFISDRDTCYRCYFLYKMNYQGDNVQKVSHLQLEDSWMDYNKNGSEIIVSGRIGKDIRHQLFVINSNNGTYRQITNDTLGKYKDPAFSPDGKKIAFVYKKNKRDKSLNDEVFVMDSDGKNLKQLTFFPKNNVSYVSNGYKAGAISWHPTENFISYLSMQDNRHNIYAVTPDGKKQWRLTQNDFSEGWHSWSSDGKWLVFDSSNADESQYHIMLMNWQTKVVTQLTDSKFKYQQSPVFIMK